MNAVIFDIDGTLVDSVDYHAKAWQRTFSQYGKEIPFDTVRSQIGKGGDQLMPEFFSEEELAEFGSKMEKDRSELFKSEYLPRVQPFSHVRPLFLRIREEGLSIALASSAKRDEAEYYARLCEVDDLVEGITSGDDVTRSKPHPDIMESALILLGDTAPELTVVVGDSPFDIIAARKVKLPTIGMLCGGFHEEELREQGVIAIYKDPASLLSDFGTSPLLRLTTVTAR